MADSVNKSVFQGKKRKQKGFFIGNKKKKHGKETLTTGIQGVLITCEGKEKMCVRESYDLLNEYADKLYGKEHIQNNSDNNGQDASDEDIESTIAKEIEDMKSERRRRFKSVLSGANNVVFIKCSLPEEKDPVELVHNILTDIATSTTKKTRFCKRFLPISATCYAKLDEIKNVTERLAQLYFLVDDVKPAKFCVMYKNRNNSDMHRNDVITAIAGLILGSGKGHQVDLRNPDFTICVEIIKTVCCISIVKDYFILKKYNIQELGLKEEAKSQKSQISSSTPSHSNYNLVVSAAVQIQPSDCESSTALHNSKSDSDSNNRKEETTKEAKTQKSHISSSIPCNSNLVGSVQLQPSDCPSSVVLQNSKANRDTDHLNNDQENEEQKLSSISENASEK